MATPTDDAYACPLNGAVAAGRHLPPAWLPGVGEIADVSLDTLYDVRGADSDAQARQQIDAWAGAAFAETHGAAGSLIFHTGGHISQDSNSVYSYDIAARRWKQERPAVQQFLDAENYIADEATGWMWAAEGGVGLQDDEPFASHTYAWLTWLSPDVLPGSPSGWLALHARPAIDVAAWPKRHATTAQVRRRRGPVLDIRRRATAASAVSRICLSRPASPPRGLWRR